MTQKVPAGETLLELSEALAQRQLREAGAEIASAIAHALGVVARARGMSALSRQTGIPRTTLYKALSGQGNPELATVAKAARALGFRLTLAADPRPTPSAEPAVASPTKAA